MIKRVFVTMSFIVSMLISGCTFQNKHTEEELKLRDYLREHPWSRWVSSDNKMTIIGGTNKVDEDCSLVIQENGEYKKYGRVYFHDFRGNITTYLRFSVYSEGYDYESENVLIRKRVSSITDDGRMRMVTTDVQNDSIIEDITFNCEPIPEDKLSFYYYSVREMYCDYLNTSMFFGVNTLDSKGILGFDNPERECFAYYCFGYLGTSYYIEPLGDERIKIIDYGSKRFDYGTAKASYEGVSFSLENRNLSELPSNLCFRIV